MVGPVLLRGHDLVDPLERLEAVRVLVQGLVEHLHSLVGRVQLGVGDDTGSFEILGLASPSFQVGKTHENLDRLLPVCDRRLALGLVAARQVVRRVHEL